MAKIIWIIALWTGTVLAFTSKTRTGPIVRGIDGQVDERVILKLEDDDTDDGLFYL